DDIVIGGGDNDNLQGGDGNDRLYGGAGVDSVTGGNGDDIIYVVGNEAEFDGMTAGAGNDTMEIFVRGGDAVLNSFLTTNGIEKVNGNGQAIHGNANANVLNFSLTVFNSVKFVNGEDGNDAITGTVR